MTPFLPLFGKRLFIKLSKIDLRSQFPEGTTIPKGVPKLKGYSSTREYILSYDKTKKRYLLLKGRVERFLKESEKE